MTTPAFSQTFAIDAKTGLIKRAAAQSPLTATGYVGAQFDQGGAVVTDMALVLNIESIDIASGNEVYTFRVVGSNVADRSDGAIIAMMQLGHAGTIGAPETVNTPVGGRYTLLFRTERNGLFYRYIDLHLTAAGTTPSIGFNAYMTRSH